MRTQFIHHENNLFIKNPNISNGNVMPETIKSFANKYYENVKDELIAWIANTITVYNFQYVGLTQGKVDNLLAIYLYGSSWTQPEDVINGIKGEGFGSLHGFVFVETHTPDKECKKMHHKNNSTKIVEHTQHWILQSMAILSTEDDSNTYYEIYNKLFE